MQKQTTQPKKAYVAPAVIYEAPLEVRAGTPLRNPLKPNFSDPAKLWKK